MSVQVVPSFVHYAILVPEVSTAYKSQSHPPPLDKQYMSVQLVPSFVHYAIFTPEVSSACKSHAHSPPLLPPLSLSLELQSIVGVSSVGQETSQFSPPLRFAIACTAQLNVSTNPCCVSISLSFSSWQICAGLVAIFNFSFYKYAASPGILLHSDGQLYELSAWVVMETCCACSMSSAVHSPPSSWRAE